VISSDDVESGDGERFGGISFGENESAELSVSGSSFVGVFEFDDTRYSEVGKSRECKEGRREKRGGRREEFFTTHRAFFPPSVFFMSLSCLNLAHERMLSMIPDLVTAQTKEKVGQLEGKRRDDGIARERGAHPS